jgi:hypothetical protein
MFEMLTKDLLSEDLQTYSGLTPEQAARATQFIFDHVVTDGEELLVCESRDRWVEYLEIGLEFDDSGLTH